MKKSRIKDVIIYLIPPLIVLIIMMIVFLYKGFYPFGSKVLLQIDADYNYVPTYYKIYDIFYNHDSFLWDFKLGGGSNIYGSLVMNSIYSPLNWLVIFTSRGNIVNFYNVILVIKFMFMSFTMFIFIRKTFRNISNYWQVLFSVIYVFSGWTFLMFSNIFYIDTVILFPIIVLFLIKLFKEQKPLGFILTLSYALILNFYLAYMIYLFVIFASFLYLVIFVERGKRKNIIMQLSFSLVISLGISAFASLPALVQILSSSRGLETHDINYFSYLFLKISYLCMSSIILLFSSKYLIDYKKHKKESLFFGLLIFLTTIGVIIEPINLAWHTGSYNSFPYRYSFIVLFIMICMSIRYLESSMVIMTMGIKKLFLPIIFIVFCVCLFILNFNNIIVNELIGFDISKPGIFITIVIICSFLLICHHFAFKLKKDKFFYIINSFLIVFEVLIFSNWNFNTYIGYDRTISTNYIKENINYNQNDLYKYSDYHGTFTINGSYILRKATIANWLHIIPSKQMDFMDDFGYSHISGLMNSFGGTIFSDTLIGVTDVYSLVKLSDDFFTLDQTTTYDDYDIYYYKLKNDIPFGFLYVDSVDELSNDLDFFETQNYYYRQLFNKNDDIIHVKEFDINKEDIDGNLYHLTINNKESKILYLDVTEELLNSNFEKIIINNTDYYSGNLEKIVYLDSFNDKINIDIKFSDDEKSLVTQLESIKFGYVTLKDYNEFVNLLKADYNVFEFDKNFLHINIDVDEDCYLFLPINNIDGWSIWNNGQEIKIDDVVDVYMQIKLNKGNNDIEMIFIPPYFKKGIIISIISLFILFLVSIFHNKLYNVLWIQKFIVFMYYTVTFILFFVVYILSNFILM